MHQHVPNRDYKTFRQLKRAILKFLKHTIPGNWNRLCDRITDNFPRHPPRQIPGRRLAAVSQQIFGILAKADVRARSYRRIHPQGREAKGAQASAKCFNCDDSSNGQGTILLAPVLPIVLAVTATRLRLAAKPSL
jgi:hypothetical protein